MFVGAAAADRARSSTATLQFYEALQKKNIPSGLIIFPDEGLFKTHLK